MFNTQTLAEYIVALYDVIKKINDNQKAYQNTQTRTIKDLF